jgi:hypothetical protein
MWKRGDVCEVKTLGTWRQAKVVAIDDPYVTVLIQGVSMKYRQDIMQDSESIRKPETDEHATDDNA